MSADKIVRLNRAFSILTREDCDFKARYLWEWELIIDIYSISSYFYIMFLAKHVCDLLEATCTIQNAFKVTAMDSKLFRDVIMQSSNHVKLRLGFCIYYRYFAMTVFSLCIYIVSHSPYLKEIYSRQKMVEFRPREKRTQKCPRDQDNTKYFLE